MFADEPSRGGQAALQQLLVLHLLTLLLRQLLFLHLLALLLLPLTLSTSILLPGLYGLATGVARVACTLLLLLLLLLATRLLLLLLGCYCSYQAATATRLLPRCHCTPAAMPCGADMRPANGAVPTCAPRTALLRSARSVHGLLSCRDQAYGRMGVWTLTPVASGLGPDRQAGTGTYRENKHQSNPMQ
jgi:hypothetical protein